MKKVIMLCGMLLLAGCSPVDSVRVMDQQQTEQLVHSMYPVQTNSALAGIAKNK